MNDGFLNFAYVKQYTEIIFCIVFGSKRLTHIFITGDKTAPSMDQICKFPLQPLLELSLIFFGPLGI